MHLVPSLAVFCACGTRKFSEWAPHTFSLLPLLSLLSKRVKITFSSYFLSFLLLSSYFLLKQTDCKFFNFPTTKAKEARTLVILTKFAQKMGPLPTYDARYGTSRDILMWLWSIYVDCVLLNNRVIF